MSSAWQYYIATLLVYFGVNAIACWALNLQYGVSGVLNFAFIMFQSMGAYTAAVVTLGPSSATGYQHYIVGWSLPWPLSLVAAMIVGGVLALGVGLFALRPPRTRLPGDGHARGLDHREHARDLRDRLVQTAPTALPASRSPSRDRCSSGS